MNKANFPMQYEGILFDIKQWMKGKFSIETGQIVGTRARSSSLQSSFKLHKSGENETHEKPDLKTKIKFKKKIVKNWKIHWENPKEIVIHERNLKNSGE